MGSIEANIIGIKVVGRENIRDYQMARLMSFRIRVGECREVGGR